jgi:hypothetical protein
VVAICEHTTAPELRRDHRSLILPARSSCSPADRALPALRSAPMSYARQGDRLGAFIVSGLTMHGHKFAPSC